MALGVLLMLLELRSSLISRSLVNRQRRPWHRMSDIVNSKSHRSGPRITRRDSKSVNRARAVVSRSRDSCGPLCTCIGDCRRASGDADVRTDQTGRAVIDKTFFTTVPATPTLVAPNATGGSPTPSSAVWPSISTRRFWRFPWAFWSGSTAETESKMATSLRVVSRQCGALPILMALSHFISSCTTLNIGFSALAGSFALAS